MEPRINCNANLFGTVRTKILNRITYWKTKIIDVGKKNYGQKCNGGSFCKNLSFQDNDNISEIRILHWLDVFAISILRFYAMDRDQVAQNETCHISWASCYDKMAAIATDFP